MDYCPRVSLLPRTRSQLNIGTLCTVIYRRLVWRSAWTFSLARISVSRTTALIILKRRGLYTLACTLTMADNSDSCKEVLARLTSYSVYIEFEGAKLHFHGVPVLYLWLYKFYNHRVVRSQLNQFHTTGVPLSMLLSIPWSARTPQRFSMGLGWCRVRPDPLTLHHPTSTYLNNHLFEQLRSSC